MEEEITSLKLSVKIKYKSTYVFINLEPECEPCQGKIFDTSKSSEFMIDCVHGVITFLRMTKYKLYPARPQLTFIEPSSSSKKKIFQVFLI